jgi:hypothetical protein
MWSTCVYVGFDLDVFCTVEYVSHGLGADVTQ